MNCWRRAEGGNSFGVKAQRAEGGGDKLVSEFCGTHTHTHTHTHNLGFFWGEGPGTVQLWTLRGLSCCNTHHFIDIMMQAKNNVDCRHETLHNSTIL